MKNGTNLRTMLSRSKRTLIKSSYRLVDQLFDSDLYTRYRLHTAGYHNPDYTFEKDQICFIHLPKTGGTSLASLLSEASGDTFVNLHIHRPVSRHCRPDAFKYMTILRNPVDRVWSYYQMVLREYDGYPYQKYARRGLKTFLERSWPARDLCCRYLSAEVYTEPDAVTLDKARQHLDCFYRVILFEDFAEDVPKFLDEHQVPYQRLPHERKAVYDLPTLPEASLIGQYNQLDIALYETWLDQVKTSR